MIKKNVLVLLYLIIAVVLIFVSILFAQNQGFIAVKSKLISIKGGDFIPVAGLYEGNLVFDDVILHRKHTITLCTQNWPDLKLNEYYKLNLIELEKNTRLNGMLAGCYLGTLIPAY